jgi:hypothetical protein
MNESNKLIAEFMGYEVLYRPNSNGFIELSETELCDVDDLQYHEDWNWLMPVVHKCFEVSSFKIEGDMKGLVLWLQIADIKGAYRTIVEFITVYNRTNGNNND